jgi:hypothetical protein
MNSSSGEDELIESQRQYHLFSNTCNEKFIRVHVSFM